MKAKLIPRIFNSEKSKLEDKLPLATPYSVHIDICSSCNFKCNFCFQSEPDAMKQKGYKYGSMKMDLFKKITNDLLQFNDVIRKVKIGLHGEPTIHPKLPEMIRYMKSMKVTEIIEIFTNGSLLNPKLNRELVDAGLDRVNLSIEGLTSAKYLEVTQTVVNMEKFVANIRDLYDNRKGLKIYVKVIDINLCSEEKDKFFDTFGDICDEIYIENVVPQWNEINKFDVDTTGMYGQKVDRYKEVCPFPFMYMHFNFDGSSSPCTLDWGKQVIIGDVSKESALQIWQGQNLKNLQVKMLEKKRSEIPFCDRCLAPLVCCIENLDDFTEELLTKYNT